MFFKNRPFSLHYEKRSKEIKKKKKNPKDITLQAKLVWFVKMRSGQLYMQKAVRSDDSTLRSDAGILMLTSAHTLSSLHLSVSIGVRCPILSAMPKSRHTSVLTGESMARATSLPVHCSNVDMSQGFYMGKPP